MFSFLIPTMLFALNLGYVPIDTHGVYNEGNLTVVNNPALYRTSFEAEAQWSALFVGGEMTSDCTTVYDHGFTPTQMDYRAWAGLTFDCGAFTATFRVEHECFHTVDTSTPAGIHSAGVLAGSEVLSLRIASIGTIHDNR